MTGSQANPQGYWQNRKNLVEEAATEADTMMLELAKRIQQPPKETPMTPELKEAIDIAVYLMRKYPSDTLHELASSDIRKRDGVCPRIICLCGSTRFFETFQEVSLQETLAGRIVLSIGCNLRSDNELWSDPKERDRIKRELDELHKRKIDLSDEVLVLNVGGYIGESTRSEIDYAISHGKPVRYLEARKESL